MSRYWVVWQVRGLADVTVDTSHQERITVRTGQQLWDWWLYAANLGVRALIRVGE